MSVMKKQKSPPFISYKRDKTQISGEANEDVIKLVRNEQHRSWVFKFIRLILGYLVADNYVIDAIKSGIKLLSCYL